MSAPATKLMRKLDKEGVITLVFPLKLAKVCNLILSVCPPLEKIARAGIIQGQDLLKPKEFCHAKPAEFTKL
jgi:hypothetical protein